MRIVVFSDTHGNFSAMHKIFKRNGNADLFIFLGDGEIELAQLKSHYSDFNILSVSGNCDICSPTPNSNEYILPDGRKIFFTHGNKLGVKGSTDRLLQKAKDVGADFALFGHTHCRYCETKDGIMMLNPGSAGCPRDGLPACYAWIDILENGVVYNHVNL